jgi:hypothetical protein
VALIEAVRCDLNGSIGGYCNILRGHIVLNTKRVAKTEDALSIPADRTIPFAICVSNLEFTPTQVYKH